MVEYFYEIQDIDYLLETIEVLALKINKYIEKIDELENENILLIEEIRELN